MKKRMLKIAAQDTVAVVLQPVLKGEQVTWNDLSMEALDDLPAGHKIALVDHAPGTLVIKYGYPIGVSTRFIRRGEWVHTHNLRTRLAGPLEYVYEPSPVFVETPERIDTFEGYVRENGEVGIRNEIWILPTVGCVNKTAERLALWARETFDETGIDGVFPFIHPYGCSQLGDDLLYTQRVLAALARHPNAAGVLVIGLGCENNHVQALREALGPIDERYIKFLVTQEVEDEIATGIALLKELADVACTARRVSVPVSKLRVGLKCGGSDGFSGITANPLVGRVADYLIQQGATALLTEVPEMFGAETILFGRACNREVFQEMVSLINGFKEYYLRHGQPVYENPSPGNKEGGITTLEEKSLGCIQKGGMSPVAGVLRYGESVRGHGLYVVEAPGNDAVSVTALAAAGAHLILFTTGRGTPLGGPVPTIKISSNHDLAVRKSHWIDFDAGLLLEDSDVETLRDRLYEQVLSVASGKVRTRNELNGYREIAIFKDGVTL